MASIANAGGGGTSFSYDGNIMNPNAMIAASVLTRNDSENLTTHPLIPLGTTVNVQRADNPTISVQVQIVDDGPLRPGRIIDFSPAAMSALNDGVVNALVGIHVYTVP